MQRRLARERAMQAMFQIDIGRATRTETETWLQQESQLDSESSQYACQQVETILANLPAIDDQIKRYLIGWDLDRLGGVERSILRLAVAEMWYQEDVPADVAINEAVELAKIFGDDNSGGLVNGVLDSIKLQRVSPPDMPELQG